ncbi:MAG: hypothetical protein R6V07_14810 [Armatimonadota bacterium]
MKSHATLALALGALIAMSAAWAQDERGELTDNLFANPSFEEGFDERGECSVPAGWNLYAGEGEGMAMEPSDDAHEGETALVIRDDDPTAEIGIHQEVEAEGTVAYEASAMVRALKPSGGAGAYLQMRFYPSNEFEQVSLGSATEADFRRVSLVGVAPEGTEIVRVYYYTHKGPTPHFAIDSASLVGGVEPPPPPPPPPPPADPPVYDDLKPLHLQTELVRDGKATVTIAASGRYYAQSHQIAAAIERITGVRPEIVRDTDDVAAVPADGEGLDRNFILLGNRSTNAMLEELYNRFYTLLDLRYPGEGGSVVRTCHNPFGDGHNLIYVGGSDDEGVASATETLVARLEDAGGRQGALTIDRLAEITPGEGVEFPRNPAEIEIWDASAGYRSVGYFGWNSISKHAAAYYMTGDEYHAREFIRLAFPDDQAKEQIAEIDGERIENKDNPLGGAYHYNAHMMILFWDLIEESPVFTDEERLRVTNAFAQYLDHEYTEGRAPYALQRPAGQVGSRHGQYSAITLYCLSRYFTRDYDDAVWEQGLLGSKMAFASLEEHAQVAGESDNLFWYNTGHAPILRFMLLSGWRVPLENGVLAELLRGQDILATGKDGDWDFRSASITFLHRAAYVTQDGRWLEYLDRTGIDLTGPRVGQSFWPDDIAPRLPTEMIGHWSTHAMPEPMWARRGTGFPLADSFLFGSFRSAPDETGDFILIDGMNGASRNPYHTFAILEQRLAGQTLLKGYRNQVLTRVDGMVEPTIAMDGALRARDVVGDVAACVGEVPDAAYSNWRRTLAQRVGEYALVMDELTMRESSENIQVQTLWEVPGGGWDDGRNAIAISGTTGAFVPVGWRSILALDNARESLPSEGQYVAELTSLGIVLLRSTEPGQWLEMQFALDEPVSGQVYADFLRYVDRGVFRISLDGEVVKDRFDSWSEGPDPARVDLGHHELNAGEHRLRVEVIERGRGGERAFIGLTGISIKPEEIDSEERVPEVRHEIAPSDSVQMTREGNVFTLEWTGPASEGETLTFFSLIGRDISGDEEELACMRLADSAAAIALPEPAVAVSGEYGATVADLAIIATDHLYARDATELAADATLLSADNPLIVAWDFDTGTLNTLAAADTAVTLRLADAEGLTLDGEALTCEQADGMMSLTVPAGQHTITGAIPAETMLASIGDWLRERHTEGERMRAEAARADPPGALPEVPEIEHTELARFEGAVEHVMTIPDGAGGELICAAEAETIHLLQPDGTEIAIAQTDGAIRDLHWWPEHELLLAACADEQLIAFDRSGERQWVFVSEMHPAVFRAAKTYWFKSAPAHAGLWGVTTHPSFIDGESQAIIGSACTLEFVDGQGQLVHRMPQFWGDPHVFQFIDGPGGSVNLLAARRINGTHRVGIVNNETLAPDQRGFHATPPGHTYVGGWSSLNRYHLFYEDLNGDGTREVVSEINGSWNRVTSWAADGTPLHDASFGPGNKAPTRNMRDLVVADLDADGTMEVITATSSGLVVCLDHEMNREWARPMPSAPNVMMAVPAEQREHLLVACDDGTIALLDASGEVLRATKVEGRPAWRGRALIEGVDGPMAVVGTATGAIAGFAVR